jgi:DNA-binding NarL/FixJ family response regulator
MKLDFNVAEWKNINEKCIFTITEEKIIDLKKRGHYNAFIADELGYAEVTIKRKTKGIVKKILKIL